MIEISPDLLPLFYRWVCRRQRRLSSKSLYPEIAYKLIRCGLAYHHFPVGFLLQAPGAPRDDDQADEMGWAFLSLSQPSQDALWSWATLNVEDWREWKKANRLSYKKLHAIKLELQDEAIRRGLVSVERAYTD